MNFRTIGIIIGREYLNKVKKKSFLVTTFLVPILFAALCLLPTLIMLGTKEESKTIAVIDRSGLVVPYLESGETANYVFIPEAEPESVKTSLEAEGYDALLVVSDLNLQERTVSAEVFSVKPLGMDLTENMNSRVNDAIEAWRIEQSGVDNLKELMKDVKPHIKLKSYTVDAEGKEQISESGVYMALSMILGMVIYLFITLFGAMVMSSVIEEKSSRVVEVLVSSVKATELMFGKIIGVAMVALTQFLLWIVLTVTIIGIVGAVSGEKLLGGSDPTELVQTMGISGEGVEAVTSVASDSGAMSVILDTLGNINLGSILLNFFIYFFFGYLLYASLFAAIGSAVENEGDSSQLQLPLTVPLLVGFFIALYAYKAPDSALVFWGSIIPFTSPIVMLARLPFGVPFWHLCLSIGLLVATVALCAWASAKVYKVGILMFGKKSTWKDLWKWLKQN